jgi:hypothetical protein
LWWAAGGWQPGGPAGWRPGGSTGQKPGGPAGQQVGGSLVSWWTAIWWSCGPVGLWSGGLAGLWGGNPGGGCPARRGPLGRGPGRQQPSCSFSKSWHGKAFLEQGVQGAEVSALPVAFPQPSMSPCSMRSLTHGAHTVFVCVLVTILDLFWSASFNDNHLPFCLSWKVFIAPSVMDDSFAW